MEIRRMASAEECAQYETWVRNHPKGTLWQSLQWKNFQETLGREVRIYALMDHAQILASALTVIDRTAFGWSTWDIPRGPIAHAPLAAGDLLHAILDQARKERCLTVYFSPRTSCVPRANSRAQISSRHEQPAATRIIDLTRTNEEILRQMKPKGRYNITVAEKNGVRVQESQDCAAFAHLIKITGHRDNFTVHPARHYEAFLRSIEGSFLLMATSERGEPVAGLLGVIWGSGGIYYYGASNYAQRALMAPYALQWTAMCRCKAAGCTSYDLLGIAPPTVAEASPFAEATGDKLTGKPDAGPNHPWQGVSAFKEKFGGNVVIYPPEQEIVLRPVAKRLLQLKRRLLG